MARRSAHAPDGGNEPEAVPAPTPEEKAQKYEERIAVLEARLALRLDEIAELENHVAQLESDLADGGLALRESFLPHERSQGTGSHGTGGSHAR